MKQPTKQQILAETDEHKLAEWVAVFCMGLTEEQYYLSDNFANLNPCQDKALAFDLMVKYRESEPMKVALKGLSMYDDGFQKAIAKASLLSVIGD